MRRDQLGETINTLMDQIERMPSKALSERLRAREEARDKVSADLAGLEAKRVSSDSRMVKRNHAHLVEVLKAKTWDVGAVNAALKAMLTRVVVDSTRGELVLSWKHNGETRLPYVFEHVTRSAAVEFAAQ
jgi:chromosome segregation ATPase